MKNIRIKNIVVIVLVSILIGIVYNFVSGSGIDFIREQSELNWFDETEFSNEVDSINYNNQDELILSEVKAVTIEQTYKLYISQKSIFIDARDQWDFNEGHIKGAINIPEYKFNTNDSIVTSLDKNKLYVIYCEGNDCDVSRRLTQKLAEINFTNLYIFIGGWYEWENSGYPIEKEQSID